MARAYVDLHWPVVFTIVCALVYQLVRAVTPGVPPIWPALVPVLFVQPMIFIREVNGPSFWFLIVNEGALVVFTTIWLFIYFRVGVGL